MASLKKHWDPFEESLTDLPEPYVDTATVCVLKDTLDSLRVAHHSRRGHGALEDQYSTEGVVHLHPAWRWGTTQPQEIRALNIRSRCSRLLEPYDVSYHVRGVLVSDCTSIVSDTSLRDACKDILHDLTRAVFSGYGLAGGISRVSGGSRTRDTRDTQDTAHWGTPPLLPLIVQKDYKGIPSVKLIAPNVLVPDGRQGVCAAFLRSLLTLPALQKIQLPRTPTHTSTHTPASVPAHVRKRTRVAWGGEDEDEDEGHERKQERKRGRGQGDTEQEEKEAEKQADLIRLRDTKRGLETLLAQAQVPHEHDTYLMLQAQNLLAAPALLRGLRHILTDDTDVLDVAFEPPALGSSTAVGSGAFGCVVRPPLPCAVEPHLSRTDVNLVAKLVPTKQGALRELMIAAVVRSVDPTGAATSVPLPVLCLVRDPKHFTALCEGSSNVNKHEDAWQMVMPHAGNRTLSRLPDFVKSSAAFLEAMWRVVPMLGRLAYAGVEHGDLHAGNVMVQSTALGKYVVRVIDFSILNKCVPGQGLPFTVLDKWLEHMEACVRCADEPEPFGFAPGFLWRLGWVRQFLTSPSPSNPDTEDDEDGDEDAEEDPSGAGGASVDRAGVGGAGAGKGGREEREREREREGPRVRVGAPVTRTPTNTDIVVHRAEDLWPWLAHGHAVGLKFSQIVHVVEGPGTHFPVRRDPFDLGPTALGTLVSACQNLFTTHCKHKSRSRVKVKTMAVPDYTAPSHDLETLERTDPVLKEALARAWTNFVTEAVAADGKNIYDNVFACRALMRTATSENVRGLLILMPAFTVCATATCAADPSEVVRALAPFVHTREWRQFAEEHFVPVLRRFPDFANGMVPIVRASANV